MKKYIILLTCIVLLVSCGTKKKSLKQSSTNEMSLQSVESQSAKTEKVVDTTKTESGKITITEIEFYPASDTQNNVGGMDIPNIVNIKDAAIKSIKQTTIEQGTERKGQSNETSEISGNQSAAVLSKSNQYIQEVIAPSPDPYRWRYIFYILSLVAVALLYLKRIPVLNWIKTILANIRHIF
jgi:sortase (surface protein transpeptidase)